MTLHIINGRKVHTELIFDWAATFEDYDGPPDYVGTGATEDAAIKDLIDGEEA